MYGPKNKYFREQITFRDKLRSDPDQAKKYQDLKQELTSKFSTNKLKYAYAKTEFIHSVIYAT